MGEKRYLKGPKMVQYDLKMVFSEVLKMCLFSPLNMLWNTENQP